jgi:hypothetical protein
MYDKKQVKSVVICFFSVKNELFVSKNHFKMQVETQKRNFWCIKTYSLDARDVYELPRLIPSGFGCWVVEKHALESRFLPFHFGFFS